jgi:SAM-dependent methyltransferase
VDETLRKRLRRLRHPALLGTLFRLTPLSQSWGRERGTPIDRYYIERFLDEHRADIRGRVLEVADTRYIDRFGSEVEQADVLDIDAKNPRVTLVGDQARPETLPKATYDAFVLTQTLQYVFDLRSAVESIHRLLRAGGVALITVPSVSRIAASAGVDGEFWRFTTASCRRLFAPLFDEVEVQAYGNVLACAAFLFGMAREDLSERELETRDEFFPLLVAVRVRKADNGRQDIGQDRASNSS